MRCLNCGSTLSAFKKLTDSDFCSAEHRDSFYSDQQRLILDRLKQSAARFYRLRAGGTADAVAAAPKVEEAQAPAKLAAFLYAKLDAQQRTCSLRYFLADLEFAGCPGIPGRPMGRNAKSGLYAPLLPDVLWPRYNPGLRYFADFVQAELSASLEFGSKFDLGGGFCGVIGACGLLPNGDVDFANYKFERSFPLRMAKPKARIAMDLVRSARTGSGRFILSPFGYRNFVELAAIDIPLPEVRLDVSPIEVACMLGIPVSLRLRPAPGTRGVAFLDRVYRMRPRSGVSSPDAPSMRPIPIELLSTPPTPSHLSARTARPILPSSTRFIRLTVRSIPSGRTETIPARSEVEFGAVPVLPESAASKTFALVALDRVADPQERRVLNSPLALIAHRAFSIPSAVLSVKPAFARELATCEPPPQNRFFRGRPSGPAAVSRPGFDLLSVSAEALLPRAYVCDLPKLSLNFEPSACSRMFRMRPRSGVMSADMAELIPSFETEQLLSQPATPQMAGATDFAPSLVTRMYRMRPKAGVDSMTVAVLSSTIEPAIERQIAVAKPQIQPKAPLAGVAFVARLYRDELRVAASTGMPGSLTEYSGVAIVSPDPVVIGSQVHSSGQFSPPIVGRLFRGRPRAGANSDRTAAYSSITPSSEPLRSTPALRSMELRECTPAKVLRLFRFRPQDGVNAVTAPVKGHSTALPFPPQKPEFLSEWWDVVSGAKPIFMNRMFRMRFKNPAQDSETLSQTIRTKQLPAVETEPVLASLPKNSAVAAPSFLHRLYRMRPKSGKDTPPAANAIPCNPLEPRAGSGMPSAVLQAVSKQWKATPLSIKTIAATLPLLLMLALFPLELSSKAAAEPLRKAIVQRAAVEHRDDFVGELAHWQGVAKWKRVLSGGIQPVGLGLFKPSLVMRNYVVEFSAQIQKGGVGVVVRAVDERNYQAVRLVTLKPGPLPTVAIVRYAVVDGKEVNRHQTILPMTVAADTVYRVSLDVNDQSFTLMVQGKVVDFWSEEQLKTGGAGFFGAKGERAWVQNLRMFHQNDAIGRLFAALALQNVQASDGSQIER